MPRFVLCVLVLAAADDAAGALMEVLSASPCGGLELSGADARGATSDAFGRELRPERTFFLPTADRSSNTRHTACYSLQDSTLPREPGTFPAKTPRSNKKLSATASEHLGSLKSRLFEEIETTTKPADSTSDDDDTKGDQAGLMGG